MNNFVQPGEILPLVAPLGGVESGKGYQIGSIFAVATGDADADAEFQGLVVGVVDLVKTTSQAWSAGDLLYWDDSGKKVTTTAGANLLIGVAPRDEDSAAAVGRVRLNGAAVTEGGGSVSTAEIADGAITFAKAAVFVSTEQTGTGSSQNVAHGLGVTPAAVWITVTELPDAAAETGFDVAEGSHGSTNVVVTVTNTVKFKVMAWA